MLYTNLKHIETAADYNKAISENKNVVVICGNMGHLSISVYRIVEEIENDYRHVKFYDLEFDNPESNGIRNLQEVIRGSTIPFILYYKSGKVVKVASGIQTKAQVKAILDKEFTTLVNT